MGKGKKGINLSDQEFMEKLLSWEGVSLIDFWADWCEPCKRIAPIIKAVADEYRDVIHVFRVDIDVNPTLAEDFSVLGIPTIVIYKDTEEVNRIVGLVTKKEIIENLKPYI